MDAEAPSFAPGSFDAVISRNLTWTLPNLERAYRAWANCCVPAGFSSISMRITAESIVMSCRNFMLTKIYRLRAGESMKPSSMSFSPVRACGPIGTQCSCGQQALLTLRSIMAFGSASTVRLTNF